MMDFAVIDERFSFAQSLLLRAGADADSLQRSLDPVEGITGLGAVGSSRQTARPTQKNGGGNCDCCGSAPQRTQQGSTLESGASGRRRHGSDRRRGSRGSICRNGILGEVVAGIGAERGEETGKLLEVIAHIGRA